MTTATKTRRVRVTLPPPHSPGQRELIETPLSGVLLGGGRYGKTEAYVRRMIRAMIVDPGVYFWIGLDRPSASYQKAWRMFRNYWSDALREAGFDPSRHVNKSRHDIELPNGSLLMMRTAANPQSIAGDGPKGVCGDEFTYWNEDVWLRFIYPALADHNAWCHLFGRPHGENWGSRLWRNAATWDGWIQRRYTIYDNPLLDPEFIADQKARTPQPIWDQEYMAIPGTGSEGVIPLELVEAAVARWQERKMAGTLREGDYVLGIDVSEGGGGDLTTFAHRYGWTIAEITDETPPTRGDMSPVADKAIGLLAANGGYAMIDAIGVGAWLPGAIRRGGGKSIGFKASRSTKLRDSTGEFGFTNTITAAWWNLRELLAPDGPGVALPPDNRLITELTTPRAESVAGHKYRLDPKDKIKKTLGRSPDLADAVVMAFWDRTILKPRGR